MGLLSSGGIGNKGGSATTNKTTSDSHNVLDSSDKSNNVTTQSGVAAGGNLVYNVTDGGLAAQSGRLLEGAMTNLTHTIEQGFVLNQNIADSTGRTLTDLHAQSVTGDQAQTESVFDFAKSVLGKSLDLVSSAGAGQKDVADTALTIAASATGNGFADVLRRYLLPVVIVGGGLVALFIWKRK